MGKLRLRAENLRARAFLIARDKGFGVNCLVIQCHCTLRQLQSCLDGWDVEIIQLGAARVGGAAYSVALPSLRVVRLQAGKSIVIRGTASPLHDCLIVSASRSEPARWLGQPIDAQHFAVTGSGARVELFLPADATLCVIDAGSLAGILPKRMQLRTANSECVARLLSCADVVVNDPTSWQRNAANGSDGALAHEVRIAMENSETLLPEMSSRSLRTWAVERACRYIDARLTKPISLGNLSRHCGVGIRTLEYSFRQFYGTTPIGFIKSQRLTHTHNALTQLGAQATSISRIARRTGFTHMGQYCQDYRALFGESPSMTLQRALRMEDPNASSTPARSTK